MIANIICDKTIHDQVYGDIDLVNKNIIQIYDFEQTNSINFRKPTLYIGYNSMVANDIKFDILNKKIDDLTLWTFDKSEKLSDYYDILNFFIVEIPHFYLTNIEYNCFNFLLYENISNIKELTSYIENLDIKRVYMNKRGVFFLLNNEKTTVFSIDFVYLGYIDRDETIKLMKYLKTKYSDILIKDFNLELLEYYQTNFLKYKDFLERIIVINEVQKSNT